MDTSCREEFCDSLPATRTFVDVLKFVQRVPLVPFGRAASGDVHVGREYGRERDRSRGKSRRASFAA